MTPASRLLPFCLTSRFSHVLKDRVLLKTQESRLATEAKTEFTEVNEHFCLPSVTMSLGFFGVSDGLIKTRR